MVTLQDIKDSEKRIKDLVELTPVKEIDPGLFLKLENHQPVVKGFKIRGAASAMTNNPSKKVMTSALGTHGFALGHIGKKLGIHTICVMIQNPPADAEEKMEGLVDEVLYGTDVFGSTEQMAVQHARENSIPFVHPYNDEDVIAGQGTIGLELFDQIKNLDIVYVPVGGGGLISGISVALKAMKPEIEIVGVQPENMHAMVTAVEKGGVTEVRPNKSQAEKLAVNLSPSTVTYQIISENVDRFITPTEDQIKDAMREIYEKTGEAVEGAGAIAYAAAKIDGKDKKIRACIVSGGNITDKNFEKATGITIKEYEQTSRTTC